MWCFTRSGSGALNMGEMADLEIDNAITYWDGPTAYEIYNVDPETHWVCRDGRILEITKMTTAHLTRTRDMLGSAGTAFTHPSYAPMCEELERRKKAGDVLFQPVFVGVKRGVFGRKPTYEKSRL